MKKYVKIRKDDLEWILIMPSWEFTKNAVKKTQQVEKRLWKALGIKNDMERLVITMNKRKKNESKEKILNI